MSERDVIVLQFEHEICRDMAQLLTEVASVQESVSESSLLDIESDIEEVQLALHQLRTRLDESQSKEDYIREQQVQYQLKVPECAMLAEAKEAVRLRQLLWDSLEFWESKLEDWESQTFHTLDPEEVDLAVQQNYKIISELEAGLPANHVVDKYKSSVDNVVTKVESQWEQLQFQVSEFRNTFILGDLRQVYDVVDDTNIALSIIASSKFAEPIMARVENWRKTLKLFTLTLNTLALQASTRRGLLAEFKKNNNILKQILRYLESFMESRRILFPRFYFLSDKEVLDIITKVESFEWQRRLRVYWNEAIGQCEVRMGCSTSLYGYEYVGTSPRLVHTSSTERSFFSLLTALQLLNLGGCLSGASGCGKKETVMSLAHILAVHCVVIPCSGNLTHKSLCQVLSGAVQVGAWCCLARADLLTSSLLSAVGHQIEAIHAAKRARLGRNLKRLIDELGIRRLENMNENELLLLDVINSRIVPNLNFDDKMLFKVLQSVLAQERKTIDYVIYPISHSRLELFGGEDSGTKQWMDGLISSIMEQITQVKKFQFIIGEMKTTLI
ncbi:hypothetical protein B566_EDAN012432 [Ephemera danica]|nr:hypothetical protein B566_EDAN012432 [Ephemera danica]